MVKNLTIVGAGLFGATIAYHAIQEGWTVEVIEKRPHIGGNCYTEKRDGIDVHMYGAHIFHTHKKEIWDFMNLFSDFYPYRHRIKVKHHNKFYSFPINLQTLYEVFGIDFPGASEIIEKGPQVNNPNLENWCQSQIGPLLYELFVKHYTEKQWGMPANDLPASLIKRLPIRNTFDDQYFLDEYQGIPKDGYTEIIKKMLEGAKIYTGFDYLEMKRLGRLKSSLTVYTGKIDTYFDNSLGPLNYRSLEFETNRIEKVDYQGVSVINYTSKFDPQTRTIEHKHFRPDTKEMVDPVTWVTDEYPAEHIEGSNDPYYPIPTKYNLALANKYKELAKKEKNVWFGGRLADYKYYDMDDTIIAAKALWKKISITS